MKSIFTIILTTAVVYNLSAKGTGEAMVTVVPNVGGQFPHFSQSGNGWGSGGAGTPGNKISLRLIGKAFAKYNGSVFMPVDSFIYSYSNDRGGVLKNDNITNDEPLMYDESQYYTFNTANNSYQPKLRRIQTYDAIEKNEIVSLTYASWGQVAPTKAGWKDSLRYLYEYNNGKMTASKLQQVVGGVMWANEVASDIKYTGGNVSSMESPVYKVDFTYDANNNLTSMTDQSNNMGNWQFKERHTYVYNADNAVVSHTLEVWNVTNNTWFYDKQWNYTYNGSVVTSAIEYHWNGSSWANYSKHAYTYDGNHNQLEDVLQLWNSNSFVNVTIEMWEYNSQNLPTRVTTNSWNGSMWVSSKDDKQYTFYYENYFPASVHTVKAGKQLQMYPVPASGILNVDLAFNEPRPFTVAVYDVKGAVLRQWDEAGTNVYHGSLPVNDLAAGNYFIRVFNENVNLTERFSVSR